MARLLVGLSLLVALAVANPAAGQDQDLDLLLFSPAKQSEDGVASVQAQTVQLYRIPLSLRLRSLDDGQWGLRLTFPVSLSGVRIESASDIERLVKSLGVISVVPGIELEIPIGERLRLRPFGEIGLGKGSEGADSEVLYGAGVRARVEQPVRQVRLTLGGSAMHRHRAEDIGEYDGHSTFEGAVDAQVGLGFSIGQRQARGGVFTIVRGFDGLELKRENQEPVSVRGQVEVGLSFSAEPDLRIWKIKLPWLGAGYQFGEVVTGLRFYMAFPF